MTDYICTACNDNCMWDHHQLRDIGGLTSDGEIYDMFCPRMGDYTRIEIYEDDDEDYDEEASE